MSEKAAVGSWSSDLFDCFSDFGNCWLTCLCPCVSFGRIAEIVDQGTTCTACYLQGTIFFLVGGIYNSFYRTKMRRQYGIEGHQCTDLLLSCFCSPCSICQEYRELQARGFDLSAGWEENVQMRTCGVTAAPAVEGGMSR